VPDVNNKHLDDLKKYIDDPDFNKPDVDAPDKKIAGDLKETQKGTGTDKEVHDLAEIGQKRSGRRRRARH
jgi:hypothetical protein